MARTVPGGHPVKLVSPFHRIVNINWGNTYLLVDVVCWPGNNFSIKSIDPNKPLDSGAEFNRGGKLNPEDKSTGLVINDFNDEDEGEIPKDAYKDAAVCKVENNFPPFDDPPPIVIDPGGQEIWTDLDLVFIEYDPHADIFHPHELFPDGNYVQGDKRIVTGAVFGAPGLPGTYIGNPAMEALGYPSLDLHAIPANWAHDTLQTLQQANPTDTYRLSVSSPDGVSFRLQYQKRSISEHQSIGADMQSFIVNLKLEKKVALVQTAIGPGSIGPSITITIRVVALKPISKFNTAFNQPEPDFDPSKGRSTHTDGRILRTFTRTASASAVGEVCQFNSQGFV